MKKHYACVTGADRGLGFELTKQLLQAGYVVFAGQFNLNFHLLSALKQSYPNHLHVIFLDVSQDESVMEAARIITSLTTSLDVLINNSAITGDNVSTIFDQLNFDEMLNVYNVNAIGALRVIHSLYPLIISSEKKLIVNISSEAGSIGSCWRKGWFAYCASKAGLNMFSAIIHNQIKTDGGQLLVLHPGWMKTWLGETYRDEGPLTPDIPAKNIMTMINHQEDYKKDELVYMDYLGQTIPY